MTLKAAMGFTDMKKNERVSNMSRNLVTRNIKTSIYII